MCVLFILCPIATDGSVLSRDFFEGVSWVAGSVSPREFPRTIPVSLRCHLEHSEVDGSVSPGAFPSRILGVPVVSPGGFSSRIPAVSPAGGDRDIRGAGALCRRAQGLQGAGPCWENPLGSSSPAVSPRPPLIHVPCPHVTMSPRLLKPSRVTPPSWVRLVNPFGEEILPNIQPKPPLE